MNSSARKIALEPESARAAEEARIETAYARRKLLPSRNSWFDPGHVLMVQEIEREMLALLARRGFQPLADKRILEIGCGSGHWIREFIKWGARPELVAGMDLLSERIAQARRLSPPAITLTAGSAAALDFPDGHFDIVLQATVFTSILDPALKQKVAAEMLRVLRSDGLMLWYDFRFNNPRNPDVRGIERREIAELFPRCRIELRKITLAPPLARALAPRARFAAALLAVVPWLRTHYLGAIEKNS
jgi:SAM-dependent methyltransferase